MTTKQLTIIYASALVAHDKDELMRECKFIWRVDDNCGNVILYSRDEPTENNLPSMLFNDSMTELEKEGIGVGVFRTDDARYFKEYVSDENGVFYFDPTTIEEWKDDIARNHENGLCA